MTSPSDRRRAMVPPNAAITQIAADAYAEATRLGVSMLRAVELIEPLRREAARADDAYLLARPFDAAVAVTANEPLSPVITALRDRYLAAVADQLLVIVHDAFTEEAEQGRRVLLRGFGEALAQFQLPVCQRLTEPARLPPGLEECRLRLEEVVRDARRPRWDLVFPMVTDLLAADFFEDTERALLLAMASDIQYYWFSEQAKAEELAQDALRLAPNEPRVAEVTARVYRHAGRCGEAERMLRGSLRLDPHNGGLRIEYSKCARDSDDLEDAEKRLIEGLEQAPHAADVYLELLDLYSRPELFARGEYRLPILAAQASAIDPDSAYTAQVSLARAYENDSTLEMAKTILRQTIDREPARVEALVELAECCRRDHDFQAARLELDRALSVDSQSVSAIDLYARVCEEAGDRQCAIGWTKRLIEATPGNRGTALAQLAVRQFDAGDTEMARSTATTALETAPSDDQVLDQLLLIAADMWRDRGADSARKFYAPVIAARGQRFAAQYHSILGNTAYQAEDYASAADEYSQALILLGDKDDDDEKSGYYRRLAEAQSGLGQWEEAERSLKAALDLDKDTDEYNRELSLTRNDRANVAYSDGRFEEALPDYESAVALNPGDAVLHSNLALALRAAKRSGRRVADLRRATDELEKAAAVDSEYEMVRVRTQGQLDNVLRFGELIESPAVVPPIEVDLADEIVRKFDPADCGEKVFSEELPALRESLRSILGFSVPGILLRRQGQPGNEYRILLRGVVIEGGFAVPDRECVLAPPIRLVNSGVPASDLIEGRDPVTGGGCAWVHPGTAGTPGFEDVPRMTDVGYVLRHLGDVVRRHAAWFFGVDAADEWIRQTTPSAPSAAGRDGYRRQLGVSRALRALVGDGVRLDAELLARVEAAVDAELSRTADPFRAAVAAVARVRMEIRDRLPGQGRGPSVSLPDRLESRICSEGGLTAMEQFEVFSALEPRLKEQRGVRVVVTAGAARPYVRQLIADLFGNVVGLDCAVLTRAEAGQSLPEPAAEGGKR